MITYLNEFQLHISMSLKKGVQTITAILNRIFFFMENFKNIVNPQYCINFEVVSK